MRGLTKLAMTFEDNSRIIESLQNDEGLVPSTELLFDPEANTFTLRLRRHPEVEVFPDIQLSRVVKLLAGDTSLWSASALKVSAMFSISGRATIFGVPLGRAFVEASKKGIQKSRFSLPDNSFDPQRGAQADLLLFVSTTRKEPLDVREIQVWQDVRGSSEVFYSHAIVSLDSSMVRHLDGATIDFTQAQKAKLFDQAHKKRGSHTKNIFV